MSFIRHQMSSGLSMLEVFLTSAQAFVYIAPWLDSTPPYQMQTTNFIQDCLPTNKWQDWCFGFKRGVKRCEKVKMGLHSYETWRLHVCLEKMSSRVKYLSDMLAERQKAIYFPISSKKKHNNPKNKTKSQQGMVNRYRNKPIPLPNTEFQLCQCRPTFSVHNWSFRSKERAVVQFFFTERFGN